MASNYLAKLKLTNETASDLWNNYGFTLKYVGSGDAPLSKPLNGILANALSLNSSIQLQSLANGGSVNATIRGGINAVVDRYVSNPVLNSLIRNHTD